MRHIRAWNTPIARAGCSGRSACAVLAIKGRKIGNWVQLARRPSMAWTRPKLRELCIGMEINGYFAGKL
jgi:coenzyme PQQ precursor peptide PqqA